MRKTLLAILTVLLLPSLGWAQSGKFTAGHTLRATGNGASYSDGGGAAGSTTPGSGYLTELGITNTGIPLCINDALTNAAGGYHRLCFGANSLGGGLITYDAEGGASALPFQILVDGTPVLPGTGTIPTPWTVPASTITTGPGVTSSAISFHDGSTPTLPLYISAYNRLYVGIPYQNLPWLTCDNSAPSMTLCANNKEPAFQTYGDQLTGDVGYFGASSSENIEGVQYGVRVTGAQPGGPTQILSSEISPEVDNFGGAHIELYPDSTSSSGPGPYRLGTISSIVSAGSGYSVGDTPTISAGGSCSVEPIGRVLTVNGSGGVTSITIDRGQGGVCTAAVAGTINTTGGAGSGLQVTGTFGAPPYIGKEGAIQFIAYNSDLTGHQNFNWYGRTGSGTLGVIATMNELQTTLNNGLHITGANAQSSASTTAIDNDVNVGRFLCFGPDTSTAGSCQIITAASDGSHSNTALTVSGADLATPGNLTIGSSKKITTSGGGITIDSSSGAGTTVLDDPTVKFGATTPTHVLAGQTTPPALSSCGGGSPSDTGSTDHAGTVTMGTSATGCVITFTTAYASAPHCVVTWRATPLASQSYAVSTTAITLTQTSTSSNVVDYICVGLAGG